MPRPSQIECPICEQLVTVDQNGHVIPHEVKVQQFDRVVKPRRFVTLTYQCAQLVRVGQWEDVK